jgi:phytoene desaturase
LSTISVIGSGFSGLSAACYLAQAGHDVHVFEKNNSPGGRARQLKTDDGFVFDMGPSWYWMPDVYEKFFADFDHKTSDFYQLEKLKPAFDLVFGKNEIIHIPQNYGELCDLFESIEKGSAKQLNAFMQEAEFKYKTGMESLVYKPGISLMEYVNADVIAGMMRLQVFSSYSNHVRKYFKNEKLISLMEFPILFLGAMPEETPALYSLMNYAGLKLGTWYPQGGFGKVINGFVELAKSLGVMFNYNSTVEKINTEKNRVVSITVNDTDFNCDGVIAAADYQHVEDQLLNESNRNYNSQYWDKKVFAPSCLIFYIGVDRKISSFNHHTLFFDESLQVHAKAIYKEPEYPSRPLFYMCCPSRTDATVAPDGCENIFLLMPVATGLNDSEEIREKYFNIFLNRIEKIYRESLRENIMFKKSYGIDDFIIDYNAFKGNAYGLANTLMQTAIMKPKIRNKKISNLFYAGQLTVPGPGVPPAIISGKIAAGLLQKELNYIKDEATV